MLMVDLRDMAWKDNETGNVHRITEFSKQNDIDIVWYMDVETLDEHCMDIDLFVEKYSAYGLFDDLEHA
jgi:hypothetical protein